MSFLKQEIVNLALYRLPAKPKIKFLKLHYKMKPANYNPATAFLKPSDWLYLVRENMPHITEAP